MGKCPKEVRLLSASGMELAIVIDPHHSWVEVEEFEPAWRMTTWHLWPDDIKKLHEYLGEVLK